MAVNIHHKGGDWEWAKVNERWIKKGKMLVGEDVLVLTSVRKKTECPSWLLRQGLVWKTKKIKNFEGKIKARNKRRDCKRVLNCVKWTQVFRPK